jgi:hypothetical protein
MWKLLLALVVLGGLGYLGYRYFYLPPEARACNRLGTLCGLEKDATGKCEEGMKTADAESVTKLNKCIQDSKSCTEAAGCAAGAGLSFVQKNLIEFLDGLSRGR